MPKRLFNVKLILEKRGQREHETTLIAGGGTRAQAEEVYRKARQCAARLSLPETTYRRGAHDPLG